MKYLLKLQNVAVGTTSQVGTLTEAQPAGSTSSRTCTVGANTYSEALEQLNFLERSQSQYSNDCLITSVTCEKVSREQQSTTSVINNHAGSSSGTSRFRVNTASQEEIVFWNPEKAHALSLPAEDINFKLPQRTVERTSLPPTSKSTLRKEVQWRLYTLELSPSRFTRPPRNSLALWDIRVKRFTSPTYRLPPLLLPSFPFPKRSDRATRGTQCQPAVLSQGLQTDDIWENASDTEAHNERCTTTPTHDEQQHTSAKTAPTPRRWGSGKITKARPHHE